MNDEVCSLPQRPRLQSQPLPEIRSNVPVGPLQRMNKASPWSSPPPPTVLDVLPDPYRMKQTSQKSAIVMLAQQRPLSAGRRVATPTCTRLSFAVAAELP